MYGWFDRKHLGWLSRFMRKVPISRFQDEGAICASRFMSAIYARLK